MDLEITVLRYELNETQTWGKLLVNGTPFCDTLEDMDRFLEVVGCGEKVYGKTAIPLGKYEANVVWWQKNNNWYLLLKDVPCFTGIFVHEGNGVGDTYGCILLGSRSNNSLTNSKATVQRFRDLVVAARDLGKKIFVTIERK